MTDSLLENSIHHSAFYHGSLRHRRWRPKSHHFNYRIGLLYLDLDEANSVLQLSRLFKGKRFAPLSFNEKDYLPHLTRTGSSLRQAVIHCLEEALGDAPKGRICLLTQPCCWGFSFNQVNFYYCFDADDKLAALIAEVSNTPWKQRYQYVMRASDDSHQHFAVTKSFHVSPFLPRDLEYHLHFSQPDTRLSVHMEDHDAVGKLFDATLRLERQALDRRAVHRYIRAFPWMSIKSILAIYWQALRLALKRIPIHSHQPADGHSRAAEPIQRSRHEEH